MKTMLKMLCLVTPLSISFLSSADVNLSGFASINAGKVLNGDGLPNGALPPTFLADYPYVSAYDEDISFKPESLVGLQVDADLLDGLSFTTQIVSRGANDFEAEFEWAYLSYKIDDQWTLQAGRKRLPLFYYSDFFDVGYAYVWMRPAADNYTWQIVNYNGFNIQYDTYIGDWSLSTNLYTGSEDDTDNKLLGQFFFKQKVREYWKGIIGGVALFSRDWFELRTTYMTYKTDRYLSGKISVKDVRGKFYGLSANFNFEKIFFLTELNRLKTTANNDFRTYMLTTGYNFGNITPFVSISSFKNNDNAAGENHSTKSIGIRWDFHSSAAFKVQYDKVDDKSTLEAVAGDSDALTVGIDLVF